MGLIKAALSSASGVLGDQWKEYFYCDAMPDDVLAVKAKKRTSGRSSNHGADNIISNGSVISVADGQCMLIVDNGKIVDVCAETGDYTYDMSSEPSIFTGGLNKENIKAVFANVGKRISFGGEAAKEQRVYYINTRELVGNKYGTPSPVPFRVVDQRAGIDMDISIRCFGEYSYHITNPLLFYTNLCGNITSDFTRDRIDSQLKSELLTYLQQAFAKVSDMGVRYSALPGHTVEIADALNEVMSKKWRDRVGIEIAAFGVSSVKANEDDEALIKEMQRTAAYTNPGLASAYAVTATGEAMKTAAGNAGGAAMGFMGMNMAMGMGGGFNQINNMQAAPVQPVAAPAAAPAPAAPAADGWTCPGCGAVASGKFCPECGTKKPEPPKVAVGGSWTCTCGAVNSGKFCQECGAKKPESKCPACGWEPANGVMPKFCPECGQKL